MSRAQAAKENALSSDPDALITPVADLVVSDDVLSSRTQLIRAAQSWTLRLMDEELMERWKVWILLEMRNQWRWMGECPEACLEQQ